MGLGANLTLTGLAGWADVDVEEEKNRGSAEVQEVEVEKNRDQVDSPRPEILHLPILSSRRTDWLTADTAAVAAVGTNITIWKLALSQVSVKSDRLCYSVILYCEDLQLVTHVLGTHGESSKIKLDIHGRPTT